jgi:hypothetical protein
VERRICTSFLGGPGHVHPENFWIYTLWNAISRTLGRDFTEFGWLENDIVTYQRPWPMFLLYRLSLVAPIWPIEVGGPRVLTVWAHSSYATDKDAWADDLIHLVVWRVILLCLTSHDFIRQGENNATLFNKVKASFHSGKLSVDWNGQEIFYLSCELWVGTNDLKMRYSPYVNKGFVYISVSKILNFIRQLFIFSWF